MAAYTVYVCDKCFKESKDTNELTTILFSFYGSQHLQFCKKCFTNFLKGTKLEGIYKDGK